MQRTQLYLSDEIAAKLRRLSRKERKTVSQLVREALEAKYLGEKRLPLKDALNACRGLWADRKDFDAGRFIRSLREDNRSQPASDKA